MKNMIDHETVGYGFIGAGQIAVEAAKSLATHPEAKVVAAQDLNAGRLAELCSAHGIGKAYATAEELFADPEVDAVYIAVPTRFHAELAIQALEAGKHVLLEKPFALTADEASRVLETARRRDRVFMMAMNMRFKGNFQRMRALGEGGAFGEIYHVRAGWYRRSGIPKLGTWFVSKETSGGGVLMDIGPHLLDLCCFMAGNFHPVSATAVTHAKFGNRGLGGGTWGLSDHEGLACDVEDFASGLIRMADGCTISFDLAWACQAEEINRMEIQIFGTEGGAIATKGRFVRLDPATREPVVQTEGFPEPRFAHGNKFFNFTNHLLGREDLCVTTDQALAVQRIIDALYESARTGREVAIPSL